MIKQLASLPNVEIRVRSEGIVAEELRQASTEYPNLTVSGWVNFESLPKELSWADILLVMIEADAGVFSVPSKVLTYLCAGRAILGSIPNKNLSARILCESGAGLVSEPGDDQSFIQNAFQLLTDGERRMRMGAAGRTYAEQNFGIDRITDRFELVFTEALNNRRRCSLAK